MPPSSIWQGLWSSVVLNRNWKRRLAGHCEPRHRRAPVHTLCAPRSHHNAGSCRSAWRCGLLSRPLRWNNAVFFFLSLGDSRVWIQTNLFQNLTVSRAVFVRVLRYLLRLERLDVSKPRHIKPNRCFIRFIKTCEGRKSDFEFMILQYRIKSYYFDDKVRVF